MTWALTNTMLIYGKHFFTIHNTELIRSYNFSANTLSRSRKTFNKQSMLKERNKSMVSTTTDLGGYEVKKWRTRKEEEE